MSTAATDQRTRLRLWLRLLASTTVVERAIRRRLRAEFGVSLPRFDVMAALERAPDGLSMSELSRRLMVSNGNATVLVRGLEADGLVRRSVHPGDRRSVTVALTAAGRKAFAGMADVHARWVQELLGGLDEDEVEQLSELLHRARASVEARS